MTEDEGPRLGSLWKVLVAQLHLTLCNAKEPARLLCPWDSPRQEYWSGLPFPSPGDLPDTGIEPGFPVLQADSLPSETPGKPGKSLKSVPFGADSCEAGWAGRRTLWRWWTGWEA